MTGAFDDIMTQLQPSQTAGGQGPGGEAAPPSGGAFSDIMSELHGPSGGAAPSPEAGAFWSSKFGRALQGAGEPILGAAQLASHLTGVGTEYVDRKSREAQQLGEASAREAGIEPGGWDIPRMAGEMLSPVNAVPAFRVGRALMRAPGISGAIGRGLGLGAWSGATHPVADTEAQQDYWGAKAGDVGTGALAGGLTGPAMEFGAQAVQPIVSDAVRELGKRGIATTVGQNLGGFYKRAEDVLMSLPLVGQTVRDARQRSVDTFFRGAANETLKPLNQTLPDSIEHGRDVIKYIREIVGKAFDNAYNGVTFDHRDPAFRQASQTVLANARRVMNDAEFNKLQKEIQDPLTETIRRVTRPANQGGRGAGAMPTEKEVQDLVEQFKKRELHYLKASSPYERDIGLALRSYREKLEDAVGNQNTGFTDRMNNASRAYAMFKRMQAASANPATGAYEGVFTPTQLLSASAKLDPTMSRRAFSEGDAQLQKYAEWGKQVLPASVADSGTPERGFLMGLLGSGLAGAFPAHAIPGAIAVGAGVHGGYQPAVQNLIRRYLLSQSAPQQAIAGGIRRASPYMQQMAASNALEPDQPAYARGGRVSVQSGIGGIADIKKRAA
jgi:hypothetical protein